MGKSKNDFMNDREAEFYSVESINVFEQLSDTFLHQVDEYEAGNVDALETAVRMRKDYEKLEVQMNMRKSWIDEQKNEIESEADKYPEGYNGYKIGTHTSAKYDYKGIPEWVELKAKLTAIETNAKETLKAVEKGQIVVDKDGCEVIPAKVNRTYSVKFDKLK